jgi:hypothetical protein
MDEKLVLYQQLQKAKRDEIARRVQVHHGKIARVKERITRERALAPTPLAMLAHGDSWFDYPLSGNTQSLVRRTSSNICKTWEVLTH